MNHSREATQSCHREQPGFDQTSLLGNRQYPWDHLTVALMGIAILGCQGAADWLLVIRKTNAYERLRHARTKKRTYDHDMSANHG